MRSTRSNASRKNRTILGLDLLEERALPSGNVTAFVNGGVLNVSTSDPGASIMVSSTGGQSVVLTPLNGGTTIDGQSGPMIMDGIKFAYDVQMNGSGDFLYLSGSTGGLSVFVTMAGGGDGLSLMNSHSTGTTVLDLGVGGNTLAIGGDNFTGPTMINLGGGNNRIYFSASQFGDLSMIAGAGDAPNSIGLENVNFHDTPVLSGFQYVFGTLMPTANNDRAAVDQGGSVTLNVSANDDPVRGTLNLGSIVITSAPRHGTVTVNGDGTVTYTSNDSSTRSDSFTYVIKNSGGAISNEATVGLAVTPTVTPTPTITSTAASPTNLASIPVKVVFNENVTGFTSSGVTATNGTVSGFTKVDAKTYTFNVAPTADGTVTVKVPAGAAHDGAGQPSSAATFTITSDRTAPTVAITSTATSPTNAASIPVTVTFSQSVTGFTASKVTVTNGTVANFAGSGTVYTFNITPTADGPITVNVAAGSATDAAGNGNTAATQFSITSDRTAPTVAITSTATSPTNAASIPVTVTFSQSVTGFTASKVTVTNGTVANFAGSGTVYTFNITPTADGPITVNVAAGSAADSAGNGNTAATQFSITSDRTAPTITLDTTSTGAITGTAADASSGVSTPSVKSVALSIFDGTDYWNGSAFSGTTETFNNATTSNNSANWSYAFTTPGTYMVHAKATDGAGNVGSTGPTSVTVS